MSGEVALSSASLFFTMATVLIGVELWFVSSSWRALMALIGDQPDEQRQILCNLKGITDKKRKNTEELKTALYIGVVCFGLSIAANGAALVIGAFYMLGFGREDFVPQDFAFTRYALLVGVFLFFIALFSVGQWYGREALRIKKGK